MQIVRHNFGLKVLAIALAVTGWAYFRFASNPLLAARFDQQLSVPITPINLPVGYIAHFTDKEAVVTIESHRGEPTVKPDQIRAVLDLSNKVTGAYNLPVQLVAPNVVVHSLAPASVTLTVEKIDQKNFPLDVHYVGQQNALVVSGAVQTVPSQASVRGASSALAQVTAVRLDVPLPDEPLRFDEMLRPVAINALGAEVTGVQVSPDLIRVEAQFVSSARTPK
jgi:YbbR domain-containing protein